MKRLSGILLMAVALGACSENLEARSGASGEVCFADIDCRSDLFCVEETCTAEEEEEPRPFLEL